MLCDMELFGCFVYADHLTYEELLTFESEVKQDIDKIVFEAGGRFLEFEAEGDRLRFQATLPDSQQSTARAISLKIALQVRKGLDGSLLFVDKDLRALYTCTLQAGKWQEGFIPLRSPGSQLAGSERPRR